MTTTAATKTKTTEPSQKKKASQPKKEQVKAEPSQSPIAQQQTTEAQCPAPTMKQKEAAIINKVDKLTGAASRAVINSRETSEMGTDLAKIFRSVSKKIEATRKELVEPYNIEVKKINKKYKNWLQVLKEGQDKIDAKIGQYKLEEARKVAEVKKEAEEAGLDELVIIKDKDITRGNLATASVTRVWTYDIINVDEVPRKYCDPVLSKLRAAVESGERNIPGLNIYQKDKVNVR